MAHAYQGFPYYLFVQNKDDLALHRSMNETRIKFLGFYFSSRAPVVTFFRERGKLADKVSPDRRYIIADYFSERALEHLRPHPAPRMGLTFEHIVPKSRFRALIEDRELSGGELLSVDEIVAVLDQTWHIVVVTKEEDKQLSRSKTMPRNWTDGDDISRAIA